jgi:hypothetical protein
MAAGGFTRSKGPHEVKPGMDLILVKPTAEGSTKCTKWKRPVLNYFSVIPSGYFEEEQVLRKLNLFFVLPKNLKLDLLLVLKFL